MPWKRMKCGGMILVRPTAAEYDAMTARHARALREGRGGSPIAPGAMRQLREGGGNVATRFVRPRAAAVRRRPAMRARRRPPKG